ncbi:MAG: hypothetical protein VX252_09050 [Myxococcota bacterium]|nr:hypothetical protein [Myxococcota bacterium]
MDIKTLEAADLEKALAAAKATWAELRAEDTESICLDILDLDPQNRSALELLLRSRIELLKKGLPQSVARAQELIPRLDSTFDQAFYSGMLREAQARYLLEKRGRETSRVAYSWFRHAMDDFEEASAIATDRIEPKLRWNACLRTLKNNPQCVPPSDDGEDHGIE